MLCAAQPKKISEAEYNVVQSRHKILGTNYRARISDRKYQKSDGALIYFFNDIREYTASGDSHTVTEWGKNDGYVNKAEVYMIGETVYQLETNGTWRVYPQKKSQTSVNESVSQRKPQKETSTEYFYKGRVLFQDKIADLYEIVKITKTKLKDSEQITKEIIRNWYDTDGRLIYSEWNKDSDNQTTQTVIKFEHDLKELKLTPPVK